MAAAMAIAALSAWETRLLGRRALPVILAAAVTATIILSAAAFLGGSLATLRRQRDKT